MLAALLCIVAASAQNTIKVQAPNLVAADEQFNVTFVIEGENSPSDFEWNVGDDFQLVWGPQRGTSTSLSIVNGQRTRTSQSTYTYVLIPKKTGTFQLQAATAVVKGNKITSPRPSIEVVSNGASSSSSSSSAQSGSSQSQAPGRAAATGTVSDEDMFLRLTLSKSRAVVGETITATLKLYQRVNIAGFEDARFPTFNGFWSQETVAPTNIEFHRENIGDKIYNAAVLRSWNLIPQQSGDISIEPAELVCLVNIRNRAASTGSIFDSFFQDDYKTIRKRISSSAYTVHVSQLPAGAPASFGGGVGTFSMKAELTRDSLKTHDAASLKVTVTGKGNVALLEAPKINFPPDFEVYDVKTEDRDGGKVFEYPFIPRSHGDFTIDPVEYTYYDIQAGRYVTLTSAPLEISVARGNEAEAQPGVPVVQSVSRKDVKDLGSDIRFMTTKKPSFNSGSSFFVWSSLFWGVIAALVVLAAALYLSLRKMAAMRADVAGSKNRSATKMARKRLSQAGEYLRRNLYTAFYEELHRALLGYVSDKLNMDASDLSKENISAQLVAAGVQEPLAAEFIGLLDACEFARYAPDSGNEAMNTHYETAVSVISTIDASMKKRKNVQPMAVVALLLMLAPYAMRAADTAYPDSLWNAGVSAYADGNWSEAKKAWYGISALGVESPELLYNLGNACFKEGDYAHAILNYEGALKLDPSYADARFNLEFANAFIQDRIEPVPEFFLKTWTRKACWLMSSNAWAILSVLSFALALAMLLLFLLGSSSSMRKTGFFVAIAALVLSLATLSFASWQRSDLYRCDDAIVVRAVSSVGSSPGTNQGVPLFVLHEGTKVKILDEVGEWCNIELADGRQGWIKSAEIEVI